MRPVIVVGSGAAGLAAAVSASGAGAEVIVLEGDDSLGGTTALSGGVVWAPANHLQSNTVASGDAAAATRYVLSLADGDVVPELVHAFAANARRVMQALEERTSLEWELLDHWPDYRADVDGASGGGRSLWPRPLSLPAVFDELIRRGPEASGPGTGERTVIPITDGPITDGPITDGVVLRGPVRGRALIGALLLGVRERSEIRIGARVTRLVLDDGMVGGVEVGGQRLQGRVVLASGGFQFSGELVRRFLGAAPVVAMGSPRSAGDGLVMAQAAGAELGNMAEGWWMPALGVPGEQLDGRPYFRPLHAERAQPGAVMVDRLGRRFVDEAQNYGDVGRCMGRFASGPRQFPAAPCWLIVDGANRARYPLGPLSPGEQAPSWLAQSETVAGLAQEIAVAPETLEETVERFNRFAAKDEDPDFGRGDHPYDRWIGDGGAPHPTLAPLVEPPFFAVQVHLGCMGTRGGPRTDPAGRVLALDGSVVPGLYAAGNAAASPFGTATAAGGATLGPALTFGFLAGEAAATDP